MIPGHVRLAGAFVLAFLVLALGAGSDPRASAGPIVVVVVRGLGLPDLDRPDLPALARLRHSAGLGLLNTAVAGPRTESAALLALALGALAPARRGDLDVLPASAPTEEGDPAGVVQARRTGCADSADGGALVNLGWGALARRVQTGSLLGVVAAAAGAPVAFARLEPGGTAGAALLALDHCGGVREVPVARVISEPPARRAALLVVDAGELGPARARALDDLVGRLASSGARTLVVSARPPGPPAGWTPALALVAAAGPGMPAGLLSSPTTRTAGLVANVDVAPTILTWLGARPAPRATGHAMTLAPAPDAWRALRALDARIRAADAARVPLLTALGLAAALAGFGGLAALALRRRSAARLCGFALLALLNMPVAMLWAAGLAPVLSPVRAANPWLLSTAVVVLMAGAAAAETMGGRALARHRGLDRPSATITLAAAAMLATLGADAVSGQWLVRFSVLSSYQVPGIRYYGIGNEHMGVAIGMALLVVFMGRMRLAPAGALLAATALVIGWPGLGANAGGVVAAIVALGAALTLVRGRSVRAWHAALWAAAGVGAALAVATADRALGGGPPTHLGGALAGVAAHGPHYLTEIVARKARMNLRLLLSPGALSALAGIAVVAALCRGPDRDRLAAFRSAHPPWSAGLAAAAWSALAALLFNDSGIVAALFIVGCLIAAGMIVLFAAPEA